MEEKLGMLAAEDTPDIILYPSLLPTLVFF